MEMAAPDQVESPGRANSDAFVLHPFLYIATLKVPQSKTGSLKKSLGKLVTKGGSEKEGMSYLAQLEDARHALTTGTSAFFRPPPAARPLHSASTHLPLPPDCCCSPGEPQRG